MAWATGVGGLWEPLEGKWLLKGWVVHLSHVHPFRMKPHKARTTVVLWEPFVMAPGPESVWTDDHFNHSDLQVFALVSMTCFCCFSSQSSSQTSFQTPPGNHSFLLQPQLSPLATFILYLHTPCLQVKTTSALCLLPKWPSITRLSCDRGRI